MSAERERERERRRGGGPESGGGQAEERSSQGRRAIAYPSVGPAKKKAAVGRGGGRRFSFWNC